MKRAVIGLVVIGAAVLAWRLLAAGGEAEGTYRFVEVKRGDLQATVASTGKLQAITTVEVGTQVSGQIAEIYVDFNDHVTRGQLIARIDPTILQQEVRAAAAARERSEAEFEQARVERERIERLYERQVATESELNDVRYRFAVAEASRKSAAIAYERAQRNLAYSEIRSPIDGVVLDRKVDVGQTVAASLSAPQLFLIAEDLSQMEILASVDESDIGLIEPGQEVRFTVQAFPERTFSGTVRQVRLQSTVQENVVNYTVAVAVRNEDGLLLPGMTATLDFVTGHVADALYVPNAALRFRPTEQMREQLQARRQAAGGGGTGRAAGGDSALAAARGARRGEAQAGAGRPAGGDRGARMGTGGGHGGAGGFAGPGGPAAHGAGGPAGGGRQGERALLWFIGPDGKADAVPVRPGLSDGQNTVVEGPGLAEGMQVIAAVTQERAQAGTNPFQQPQQQRGFRPPM